MIRIFCAAALCILLAACSPRPTDLSLNQARFGHAAAVVGKDIYILAGRGKEAPLGTIERINAGRTRVETVAATITPRYWLGGATDGTTIYLAGGLDQDDVTTPLLEAWRPGENAARVLAPMPEARSRFDLILFQNRLYAIGGTDDANNRSRRVDIYDIATNQWSRGADMPQAREGDAELVGDRIVVPGGYGGEYSLSKTFSYDPKANVWSEDQPLDLPQSAGSLATVEGTLYFFGHYNRMDRVTARDPGSAQWSILELPFSLARHTDAVFDGKEVFVIGGSTQSRTGAISLVQRFRATTLASAPRRAPTDREWSAARARDFARLDRATEEVIARWADTLSRLPRLTLNRQTTVALDGNSNDPVDALDLSWQPGRILLSSSRHKLVYDGTEVRSEIRRANANAALTAPAASLAEAFRAVGINPKAFGPDIAALGGDDMLVSLQSAMLGADWRIRPDETMNGVACWVLAAAASEQSGEMSHTMHVRQDTGIVMRRTTEGSISDSTTEALRHYRSESLTKTADTVSPIKPEVFGWQPARELKRISDLNDLRTTETAADPVERTAP